MTSRDGTGTSMLVVDKWAGTTRGIDIRRDENKSVGVRRARAREAVSTSLLFINTLLVLFIYTGYYPITLSLCFRQKLDTPFLLTFIFNNWKRLLLPFCLFLYFGYF